MLNIVAIIGRFVRTPELKKTKDGTSVTSFVLANDTYGKDEANFIDCVAWRNTAETICRFFEQGSVIGIDGRLQTRYYEDRNGNKQKSTEIVVNNITFCEKKEKKTDIFTDLGTLNEEDLPY